MSELKACPFCDQQLNRSSTNGVETCAWHPHPGDKPFCILAGMTIALPHYHLWNTRIDAAERGAEVTALEVERDKWMARCAAAVSLLPDYLLIGDLQEAAREYKAALTYRPTPEEAGK